MRILALAILGVALFTHALPAQPASYSYFGTGYSPTPSFTITGLPTLGGTITVQTHGSYGGFFTSDQSVLITGLSDESWGAVSLPFSRSNQRGPLAPTCSNELFRQVGYDRPDVMSDLSVLPRTAPRPISTWAITSASAPPRPAR